jgi:hypothetical protein
MLLAAHVHSKTAKTNTKPFKKQNAKQRQSSSTLAMSQTPPCTQHKRCRLVSNRQHLLSNPVSRVSPHDATPETDAAPDNTDKQTLCKTKYNYLFSIVLFDLVLI